MKVFEGNHYVAVNKKTVTKIYNTIYGDSMDVELTALKDLGRNYTKVNDRTITMPKLGEPVTPDNNFWLEALHSHPEPEHISNYPVSTIHDFVIRTSDHIRKRHNGTQMENVMETLLEPYWSAEPKDINHQLTHVDPHIGNWLRNSDGSLVLIDWETATFITRDAFVGCLAHSALISGQNSVVPEILSAGKDSHAVDWFFETKCLRGLSWLVWKGTSTDVSERYNTISEVLGGVKVPLGYILEVRERKK